MNRIKDEKMTLDYYLGNYPTLKIEGVDISILDVQEYILEHTTDVLVQSGYEVFYKCSPIEKEVLLEEYGDNAFFIEDIYIIGSRIHGNNRKDSDLDVLIEFEGNCREDDLFTCLNEDHIEIGDIPVDINPITKYNSGTAIEWLKTNF